MEAPRHLEIATFKWYDDIRNPAELFFFAKFLPSLQSHRVDLHGMQIVNWFVH